MTQAFPGISNENSFFSDHYLTSQFAGDRRDWERRVNLDYGASPSWRQLQRLFYRSRHAYARERLEKSLPQAAGEFQVAFLKALGFDRQISIKVVTLQDRSVTVPTLARVARSEDSDALWVLEAREPGGESGWGQDPLSVTYDSRLYDTSDLALPQEDQSLRDIINAGIYGQTRPPRWILVMTLAQVVLLDRYKWDEERLLRFDLEIVLSQPQADSRNAMRSLLHRESLVPEGDTRGIERFDEESRRHAQGVSTDLKYALREAVELLGNAAIEQLMVKRRQQRRAIWEGQEAINPAQLTQECLRYLYRLLFLFYVEAQPNLGSDALRAPVFQVGYSLETLRDLEMTQLVGGEDTWFLHESLKTLFRFVREGTPYLDKALLQGPEAVTHHDFRMEPIDAELFESSQTPLLDMVSIPDRVWRRILELLSLSRPGKQGRGRISYALLGVNQLGAVYEGLLSYTGFFAKEEMVEVKRAQDSNPDMLDRAWFVPKSQIQEYEEREIVYDGNDPRIYPAGTFIYRLTGYGREEGASYYTPETLTRSTVKYALQQLTVPSADHVLGIRICEPAMGSAAFLIEAVNQLADLYLERKQKELSQTIAPDDLVRERQRARSYITARNAFGVDINPVARELGQISLWLNCMGPQDNRPDFSRTLHVGNSLIGARWEFVTFSETKPRSWTMDPETREFPFGKSFKKNEIFHFLLPIAEMVTVKAKDVKSLAPAALDQARKWARDCKKPFSLDEYEVLQSLSDAIEKLWLQIADARESWRKSYEDQLHQVYGQLQKESPTEPPARWQSEAYDRLRLAMDYWCSLWFWPLEQLDTLPTRMQFLEEMSLILSGNLVEMPGTADWTREIEIEDVQRDTVRTLIDRPGDYIPLSALAEAMPDRHPILQKVSDRERFFHWQLAFADIFKQQQGFDLIVGNPPWVKMDWTDQHALAQHEPRVILRKMRANQIAGLKSEILDAVEKRSEFLAWNRHDMGAASYCQYPGNYPILQGLQPNTYKIFLARAFRLIGPLGAIGFIHPVDHLNDPKGQAFRRACYLRQTWLFQMTNARKKYMFSDIHNDTNYAIGVYTGKEEGLLFGLIANLYAPETIEECLHHDGAGIVPGMKDEKGKWQLRGHKSRKIEIDDSTLEQLGEILDPSVPAQEARLPLLHSQELADALIKMMKVPGRLGDLNGLYVQDRMWDETNDQQQPDQVFKRETAFQDLPLDMILSGPIFSLATPWAKCPRPQCKSNKDYEMIDLTAIPDDYLPRVNYTPIMSKAIYRSNVKTVPWDPHMKLLDCERLIIRRMVSTATERCLQGALLSQGFAHIDVGESLAFQDNRTLTQVCTQWISLPYDFITKSYQVTNIRSSFTSQLPFPIVPDTAVHRALQLNCLTTHHSGLWNELAQTYAPLSWAGDHPSLELEGPNQATATWTRNCALRSDYARRQALIEIDVMVAMALDLTQDELILIYRLVFPVLQQYENNTWYDQKGRMVWSDRTGKGKQISRKEWERHLHMPQGILNEEIQDNTMRGGPQTRTIEYVAPFTKPNREDDYRQAWRYFEQKL